MRIQAIRSAGAWRLPQNDTWNVPPKGTDEVHFERDLTPGPFSSVQGIRALAVDARGGVYGMRALSSPREDGYTHRGRVSIDGVDMPANTSSMMFKRDDHSLCNVATLCVSPPPGTFPCYCLNARPIGFDHYEVMRGDLITFSELRTPLGGNPATTRSIPVAGRVLGWVESDGVGRPYPEPHLLVLATDEMASHGFIRHIAIEDVTCIRDPGTAPFTRWFFAGHLPDDTKQVCDMVAHGSMNNRSLSQYLVDQGDICPSLAADWRERRKP